MAEVTTQVRAHPTHAARPKDGVIGAARPDDPLDLPEADLDPLEDLDQELADPLAQARDPLLPSWEAALPQDELPDDELLQDELEDDELRVREDDATPNAAPEPPEDPEDLEDDLLWAEASAPERRRRAAVADEHAELAPDDESDDEDDEEDDDD